MNIGHIFNTICMYYLLTKYKYLPHHLKIVFLLKTAINILCYLSVKIIDVLTQKEMSSKRTSSVFNTDFS